MIYAYVRVSSTDQKIARQLRALKPYKVQKKNIFIEKQSGKDFDRKVYRQLVEKLRSGDLLYIQSIDRLGRNYKEILEQWRILTKEKMIDIVVLDMPLLDTRQFKDLLGTFIADLILGVLSYVAQTERDRMLARQAEGIAAAKAQGIKLGRKPRELPECFDEVVDRWIVRNEIDGATAALLCGTSRVTMYKWTKEIRATLKDVS